jgi:hypothetical protein
MEEHAKTPYFWLAWGNVALFSIGATEWMAPSEALNGFWKRIRESRGHDRVWQPCGRELVLVLVEHRQSAGRVAKHKRRRII